MDTLPDCHSLFDNIPADLTDELFQTLFKGEKVRIERIVSRGHHSLPNAWYDQEADEFVALLKGSAGLRFEGSDQVLVMTAGDFVNIPAHVRHQVAWTDPEEDTVWLAVHYLS